jgi:hypothetical protein
MAKSPVLNAYRFQEPITKISNVVLGSACTLELKPATTIPALAHHPARPG